MAGRGFAMPGMAAPGGHPPSRPPARPPARPTGSAPGGSTGGARPLPGFGAMFQPKSASGETPKVQQASELWNSAAENVRPSLRFPFLTSQDLDGVKKAIADGADVNTEDLKGVTPLLIAVNNQNDHMVDFLLSHKANVNAASLSSSPLHEAVRTHNKSMVEKILSAGADVNLKTDGGKTPLHLAAQEGLVEIFDLLLSKKADPQAMNDADTNLLHFASTQDSRHIMEKALAARVNPNHRNKNGKTPLHVAVEKNNLDSIRLLLNAGADKTVKDGWGRLPEECGKVAAYNILKRHQPGQKYELLDESEFVEGK